MGFLRRLLGGEGDAAPTARDDPDEATAVNDSRPENGAVADGSELADGAAADDEAARNRELLREDAERLEDELLQRQLRYADRSWTPPNQSRGRPADEADAEEGA